MEDKMQNAFKSLLQRVEREYWTILLQWVQIPNDSSTCQPYVMKMIVRYGQKITDIICDEIAQTQKELGVTYQEMQAPLLQFLVKQNI